MQSGVIDTLHSPHELAIDLNHCSQTQFLEGHSFAQFCSKPNQTHLIQLINLFRITRNFQAGVIWSWLELWPSRNWVWHHCFKGIVKNVSKWFSFNPGSLKTYACGDISATQILCALLYVWRQFQGKTHVQYVTMATFLLYWYRYVLQRFYDIASSTHCSGSEFKCLETIVSRDSRDSYQSASQVQRRIVYVILENPYIWSSIWDANLQKYQFSNHAAC